METTYICKCSCENFADGKTLEEAFETHRSSYQCCDFDDLTFYGCEELKVELKVVPKSTVIKKGSTP